MYVKRAGIFDHNNYRHHSEEPQQGEHRPALIRPEHRDWRDINHLTDKPSFLSFAVVSNLHTLIWIKPARYHAVTASSSAF